MPLAAELWQANQDVADRILAHAFVRGLGAVKHRLDRINMERRSKQNVAHHYDLSARLYDLFLEDEGRAILMFPFLNYSHGNSDATREMLLHPAGALGLSDGGAHCGLGGVGRRLVEDGMGQIAQGVQCLLQHPGRLHALVRHDQGFADAHALALLAQQAHGAEVELDLGDVIDEGHGNTGKQKVSGAGQEKQGPGPAGLLI